MADQELTDFLQTGQKNFALGKYEFYIDFCGLAEMPEKTSKEGMSCVAYMQDTHSSDKKWDQLKSDMHDQFTRKMKIKGYKVDVAPGPRGDLCIYIPPQPEEDKSEKRAWAARQLERVYEAAQKAVTQVRQDWGLGPDPASAGHSK